jgi:ribonuclease HII
MYSYDRHYPQYGFAEHKGYGTAAHLTAIARFGPSPLHRKTFRGVREYVTER